jgi:hypothetical protein
MLEAAEEIAQPPTVLIESLKCTEVKLLLSAVPISNLGISLLARSSCTFFECRWELYELGVNTATSRVHFDEKPRNS